MSNKSTTAKVSRPDGELTLQQHETTDSPIIPVAHLERLHQFRPDIVDFVVEQTRIEADHRRTETRRLNTLTFCERLLGQILAMVIGMAGIMGGAYVAIQGQPWAGATIASLAITGLAVAFLVRHK